jgi:hypothetical protein
MPVSQMLASMTAAELTEYMAFDRIDPVGEMRADLRAGMVAAAVVNHSMSPPRKPASALDFMPFAREQQGPIALSDPDEHAKLVAQTLFGDKVK